MPVPAVLGLPWLASAIGGMFSSVFGFFAAYLTKRVALIATVIALVFGATLAFLLLIQGLMSGIHVAFPSLGPVGLIVPANVPACISAMITGRIAHWAYGWNVRIFQYKLAL